MRWETFLLTTAIILVILLLQWPKMKQKPKKDKGALLILLLIGWILSIFNLTHMEGPTSWVQALFKPFGEFMEK